jgi:hypothetical protein
MAGATPNISELVSLADVGARVKQHNGGSEDLARHDLTKTFLDEVLHPWGRWTRDGKLVEEGPLLSHFWSSHERLFWGQRLVRIGIGPPLPRELQVRLLPDERKDGELHVFLYGDEVDRWLAPPQLEVQQAAVQESPPEPNPPPAPPKSKKAKKPKKAKELEKHEKSALRPGKSLSPRAWLDSEIEQLKKPGNSFGQAPGQPKPLRTKVAESLQKKMSRDAQAHKVRRALSEKTIRNRLYKDKVLKVLLG